jgi:hypothetical protein
MGKFYSVCKDHPESVLLLTIEKPYRLSIFLSLTSADDVTKIDILQACGTLRTTMGVGGGGERAAPRLALNEPVKRQVCPIVHGRGENPPGPSTVRASGQVC